MSDVLPFPAPPARATDEYVPGACNIGPAEVERRRRAAVTATGVTIAFYASLVALRAPRPVRCLVAFPAAGAAVSWLQVVLRFCVAFGTQGTYNFGPLTERRTVEDREAHAADVRRSRAMIAGGIGVGVLVGIVAAVVP